MKTLKIYSIVVTLGIILLSVWVCLLLRELRETNEVLKQCSERYYKEVEK